MNLNQVLSTIENDVQRVGDIASGVLGILATAGATAASPERFAAIVLEIETLAKAALAAWGNAAGAEVTAENILKLLPAPITLVAPDTGGAAPVVASS